MWIVRGRGGRRCGAGVGGVVVVVVVAGALVGCVPRFDAGAGLTVSSYGQAMRIEWPAATDPDGGPIGSYRVDVDGVEVARRSASLRRCDLAGLSAGPHEVTVTAYDGAGEWSGSASGDGTLTASVTPEVVAPDGAEPGCQPVYELSVVDAGDDGYLWYVAVSADGRKIAFVTSASAVPDGGGTDTNGTYDVFYRDLDTGVTTRVTDGNRSSGNVALSADGRYVAFGSGATNLVPDSDGTGGIFRWDRDTGTTIEVTRGWQPGASDGMGMSSDGGVIGFDTSMAIDPSDTNAQRDAYLWDATGGLPTLMADPPGDYSAAWDVSATGRSIVYTAYPRGGPGATARVWDRSTGVRTPIPGSANSYWYRASDDAGAVVFQHNGGVYRWDRSTGVSAPLSRESTFSQAPVVSADGRFVVFPSQQDDLTGVAKPAPTSLALYDHRTRSTEWVAAEGWPYPRMTPDASVIVTMYPPGSSIQLLRRIG